ncbi:MAG: zinc ribbon domain-containing protein [Oscillospiraceae bacterium]|nr:zinc ribbon domain-containing protein [Oscillospiraceae bacterium]
MANSCPKCGGELSAGATICVNCGASANAKPDVDNSAEISKMFGGGDTLSDSQIADFESGKEIELSGGAGGDDGLSELDGALSAMSTINFDEILGEGSNTGTLPEIKFSSIPDDSDSSDNESADSDDDDHDDIIIQKGVTEVHGFRLPAFVKKIIACVLILVLGFGLGYGLKYFQERGVFMNHTNEISLKSLEWVTTRIIPAGQSFAAVEIYVKKDATTTECIIFGVFSTEAGDYTPSYFRLVINNKDHSDATLFLPFDQSRYAALLESGETQDRLDAGTMMNHYESFLLSAGEINSGNPRWARADIEFVNKQLARGR